MLQSTNASFSSVLRLATTVLILFRPPGSASSFVIAPPPMTTSPIRTTATTSAARARTTTTSEELIPREVLFGNPTNVSPKLSPDGRHLAYLAPSPDGVMNVWIRDLENANDAADRMVTNEPKRAIRSASWAYDSRTILYMNDNDGDENFHLFAVDAISSSSLAEDGGGDATVPMVRDLTPGKNVKAQNVITNHRYPDQILVGTNERDSKVFDMYRVFHATGEKFIDTINPGDVIGWKTEDESFEIRAAVSQSFVLIFPYRSSRN